MIRLLSSLKQTGMSLNDIAEFLKDGCILEHAEGNLDELKEMLEKRIHLLSNHLMDMPMKREKTDRSDSIHSLSEDPNDES
ncbi:hypothetical protein [Melghirimyces algeriensis]|uniref:HTH merR-type domain-containing protein n=1 Tax=Melghirimyces algeriensis TaxID=910412 RepID=A0A521BJ64_9BACL|nr:hypothetical protein [Melghirimyces algeriensis]SMO47133.1 hypothetical protein SAMN06264849_102140 [Melghirimyces algeriensis]